MTEQQAIEAVDRLEEALKAFVERENKRSPVIIFSAYPLSVHAQFGELMFCRTVSRELIDQYGANALRSLSEKFMTRH